MTPIIEVTEEQLAAAFDEWVRRYKEDPGGFLSGYTPVGEYGPDSAAYLLAILREQGAVSA